MSTFTLVIAIAFALLSVWVGVKLSEENWSPNLYPSLTMEDILTNGAPRCDAPMILKGAFKMRPEEIEKCKKNQDSCMQAARDTVVKIFGNKNVFVYPMKDLATPKKHGVRHIEGINITVNEFLTNPEYSRHVVHALHQIGTANEYVEYLGGDTFKRLTRMPNYDYKGSQIFISRGEHTGSHLHFAWGYNLFIMLSGKKRWAEVHPAYLYDANCSLGHNGLYGHCMPAGYTAEDIPGRVSIDAYLDAFKKAGLPDKAVVEFTLEAGDILLNCDLWGHTIENLTPETIAFSLRYKADFFSTMKWRWATLQFIRDAIVSSLHEMWVNPGALTFLSTVVAPSGKPLFDEDDRLKGLGVLNQKPQSERTDV